VFRAELEPDGLRLFEMRLGRLPVISRHRQPPGTHERAGTDVARGLAGAAQCPAERGLAFRDVASQHPEARQRGTQPQLQLAIRGVDGPAERRAQVFEIPFQSIQPGGLTRPAQLGLSQLGQTRVEGGMSAAGVLELTSQLELLTRVLANGLQHDEAWLTVGLPMTTQQALVDQCAELIQELAVRLVGRGASWPEPSFLNKYGGVKISAFFAR
jgi:hypothetical protein